MKTFIEVINEMTEGKSLYNKALKFATRAHEGQIRKHVGEPYIEHPKRVAKTKRDFGFNHHVQAAALLHDTIEDCGTSAAEIHSHFGKKVHDMVVALSDLPKETGNREWRKHQDDARLAAAGREVHSIKAADTIDNAPSIRENDPDFWKVFKAEKHRLLPMLSKAHPKLLRMAKHSVDMK